MVTIIDYKQRTSEDGKSFFVLEIEGDVEFVLSHTTGKYYATTRKCSMSCTFDENTCKRLIGMSLNGNIDKVECEPYEYVVKETGEHITITHKYSYVPDEVEVPTVRETVQFEPDLRKFSKNGSKELKVA
jgi:purine nucleoside phosphorylase